MNKRLIIIISTSMLLLSLAACGGNIVENSSSVSTPIEKESNDNMPSITILQKGENTTIICEGDVVKEFTKLAKADRDAQFLIEFEDDKEDAAPKQGFSLSFDHKLDNEPFALYHNSTAHKIYTIYDKDIMEFNVKDNTATWILSGITLPLDGVEIVSIWLISGDGEPIQDSCEMLIADVKMESNVATDGKEETNNVAVDESIKLDYKGSYRQTIDGVTVYTVVVEEDRMTIEGINQAVNSSYIAEISEIVLFPESCYGNVSITCSETGETLNNVQFQIQEMVGCEGYPDGIYLGLQAQFEEAADVFISAKRD